MIVVDVNTIAYLWIPGEMTQLAENALARDPHWVSSTLWRSEFRNILAGYLRRGDLDRDAVARCLNGAESQLAGYEYLIPSALVMNTYCRKIRLDLRSGGRPLEHVDELLGEVGHGDERLEFGGDLLGSILRLAESLSERLDIDVGKDGFEGALSIEQDLHVGRILQVSDQRGFGEYRLEHAA